MVVLAIVRRKKAMVGGWTTVQVHLGDFTMIWTYVKLRGSKLGFIHFLIPIIMTTPSIPKYLSLRLFYTNFD
jgi:hypothetical protein